MSLFDVLRHCDGDNIWNKFHLIPLSVRMKYWELAISAADSNLPYNVVITQNRKTLEKLIYEYEGTDELI